MTGDIPPSRSYSTINWLSYYC